MTNIDEAKNKFITSCGLHRDGLENCPQEALDVLQQEWLKSPEYKELQTATRKLPPNGKHGVVDLIANNRKTMISIEPQELSADQLRETAHFFNQLAEIMESGKTDDRPVNCRKPTTTDDAPTKEYVEALKYAERLAVWIYEKNYKNALTQWTPLTGDLIGLLSQIDNMLTGLTRLPPPTTNFEG